MVKKTGLRERKAVENQLKMQDITDADIGKVYELFTDAYVAQIGG